MNEEIKEKKIHHRKLGFGLWGNGTIVFILLRYYNSNGRQDLKKDSSKYGYMEIEFVLFNIGVKYEDSTYFQNNE